MKTLGKQITSQWFNTPEDYQNLRRFWRKLMENREPLQAEFHMLYMILIGRDYRKGFKTASPEKIEYHLCLIKNLCGGSCDIKNKELYPAELITPERTFKTYNGDTLTYPPYIPGDPFKLFAEFIKPETREILKKYLPESPGEEYKE